MWRCRRSSAVCNTGPVSMVVVVVVVAIKLICTPPSAQHCTQQSLFLINFQARE